MEIGRFFTKNGMAYEGFRATERILPNEVLMKVPSALMLTTKIAFWSDVRVIFAENLDFFAPGKDPERELIED